MELILKAILLFFTICGTHGASFSRQKRQSTFDFPFEQQFGRNQVQQGQGFANQNPPFGQQQDPVLMHGQFVGFGDFRPNQNNPPVGQGLTLGSEGGRTQFSTPPPTTTRSPRQMSGFTIPGQGGMAGGVQVWEIGGRPVATPTVTTVAPLPERTTPSPTYLRCLSNCPSTMEYNPVCGSDAQNYHNMQRLVCANQCGNNVQFVRLGTCLPL